MGAELPGLGGSSGSPGAPRASAEERARTTPANDAVDVESPAPAPGRGWLWGLRIATLGAAVAAGYLAVVSFSQHRLPLGCGAGSGCSEVLRSRWSSVLGVPVGLLALLLYLDVFALSWLAEKSLPPARRVWRTLLGAASVAIVLSVAWFVGLQALVLGAFCFWCLIDHGLGLATALCCAIWLRKSRPQPEAGRAAATPTWPLMIAGGATLAMSLAMAQFWLSEAPSGIARLPAGQNSDTGPGPDRALAVMGGQLPLAMRELPMLGSPDARELIVVLYDYCCPHCRATHDYLTARMQNYPGQYALVMLPTPLDRDCNPGIVETEPRFAESCDLARLALAVWRAEPEQFAEFDAWLYEPESPRRLEAARAEAERLVGSEPLTTALSDPWIDRRIAAAVAAYSASGAETLPILLSPRMDAIVGRAESDQELFDILEKELGLRAKP